MAKKKRRKEKEKEKEEKRKGYDLIYVRLFMGGDEKRRRGEKPLVGHTS